MNVRNSKANQKCFAEQYRLMVQEEKLSKEKTQTLIGSYLCSEQELMRDEILELLAGEKQTLLQRKTTGERILRKLKDFIEMFTNFISG